MIIICPECHTKFRLDDDRVPAGGAKVRCSSCQHVFPVEKELPAEKIFPEEELPPFEEPEPVRAGKTGRRWTAGRKWLILIGVLVAVIVGLGFSYGQSGGIEKITGLKTIPLYFSSLKQNIEEKIADSLKAAPSLEIIKRSLGMLGQTEGVISLEKVRGYYLETAQKNKIFVIEGQAVNRWNESRSFIRVKGTLLDSKGTKVKEKVVYCGNILSEKDLKELPGENIEKSLSSQFGESFANVNIPSRKSVPFMIVFTDLSPAKAENTSPSGPAKPGKETSALSDFAVEVISSQKGSK